MDHDFGHTRCNTHGVIETHRRTATRLTLCGSCSGIIQEGEPYLVHTPIDRNMVHIQRPECGFCAVKFGRRRAMFATA
jgi:hypothetical protein